MLFMMQKGTIETEASAPGLTNVCLTLFYISTFYVKNVLGGMVLKSRLLRSSYYGFSPNINILERLTIWNNLGQLALEHCVFNMFYLLLYFAFFFFLYFYFLSKVALNSNATCFLCKVVPSCQNRL